MEIEHLDYGEISPRRSSNNDGNETIERVAERNTSWFYLLVLITEFFGIGSVAMVTIWTLKWLGGYGLESVWTKFNLHPLFSLLGFVFLNGNGKWWKYVIRKQ